MKEAPDPQTDAPEEERERWEVLTQLEDWLERPMLVLSFIWLSLVIVELVWTTSGVVELLGTIIWIIFIIEFLLRLVVSGMWWKFPGGVLRAFEGSFSQAARSRGIGLRG